MYSAGIPNWGHLDLKAQLGRKNQPVCLTVGLIANLKGPFYSRVCLSGIRNWRCNWAVKTNRLVCPVCLPVTFVYCGQTVGWIKMKLSMQLGLGPGHIVLYEDPAAPPQKGQSPQIFGPCLLSPNGWMNQDATWYGGRPRPKQLCVRWEPSSPLPKQGAEPPNSRPMSIVTKRLDGSRWHLARRWASVQATLC